MSRPQTGNDPIFFAEWFSRRPSGEGDAQPASASTQLSVRNSYFCPRRMEMRYNIQDRRPSNTTALHSLEIMMAEEKSISDKLAAAIGTAAEVVKSSVHRVID